uniref:DNA-directed RNA polymerase subunit beta'' n=2 Tax=Ophioglossum TaxID=13833 RepID=L7T0Z5_9MONI|nr:DNA-directed RNA polymerase subunit beta'' [Ophioglossum californicum]AGC26702.1 DNA-directed RNA polymerase subunit beta'' [Ophioglossum californicum]QXF60075.1 RNA polymerase beta'' subunit [Ophioglossum vulgatum]
MAERAEFLFYNKVMDRTAIKRLISRLVAHFGVTYTTNILDQLKTLGFQRATNASISLGIDDLLTASSKAWLIRDAEKQSSILEQHHRYGSVNAVERLRQSIETWYATSEYLKQEMNPTFEVTDPPNPVHMMSFSGARGSLSQVHQLVGMRGLMSDPQGQIIDLPIQSNLREGLSLTEYIISCYGARKGVVDTAVRTSDAGYLTRRLVEVVQHIVVRETDCGTIGGIPLNPLQDSDGFIRSIPQQKLIGRVLADNVYVDTRCIAIRNQDIGNELADRLVAFRVQPIHIRSPLTCRKITWICQLCYGWSLTQHELVDLGEAVGIIAGQSIGEPGTQLTLRTFHTGGVFTGDIAEHVRTPFDGIVGFNEDSVHPARTRHGHPAWSCQDDLSVSVRGRDGVYNFVAPTQSLILVQNNQYVESKQVIAEVRAEKSPPKEEVKKHVYSDSEGEMHWSTIVHHSSGHANNNVYPILGTGYVWVLSGDLCEIGEAPSSIYKDQDRIHFRSFLRKNESLLDSRGANDRKEVEPSDPYQKKQGFNKSRSDSRIISKFLDSLYLNISQNLGLRRNRISGRVILTMGRGRNIRYWKSLYVNFALRIPSNGILNRGDILAIYENPKHRISTSGTLKYGTARVNSIADGEFISEYGESTSFISRYRIIEGGNLFFIPGEIYTLHQSYPFPSVSNNSIVRAGEQIAPNIYSKSGGLIRIEKSHNNIEIRVLPGNIYNAKEVTGISEHNDALIPPGASVSYNSESDDWIYLQWITSHRRNAFAIARPVVKYNVPNGYSSDLPLEKRNHSQFKVQVIEYMLYKDGEEIRVINDANIQLVQTCLVLDWEKGRSTDPARTYILELGVGNVSKTLLCISLSNHFDPCIGNGRDRSSSKHIRNNRFYSWNNSITRVSKDQALIGCRGNIRSVSEQSTSFSTLSTQNLFQNNLYSNSEYLNEASQSDKNLESGEGTSFSTNSLSETSQNNFPYGVITSGKESREIGTTSTDSVSPVSHNHMVQGINEFALLGNSRNIVNCSSYSCGTVGNKILFNKASFINNPRYIYRVPNWYLLDEEKEICEFGSKYSIGRNNCYQTFRLPNLHSGGASTVNLGQSICENAELYGRLMSSQSGQIISIHSNSFIIRLAEPYLATEGATVHSHYGNTLKEGDTLITLTYERFKSGDIIQGLPKVEQLLEARPTNSVSRDLENCFGDWNKGMTRLIGNFWSFFLGAGISMEQSRTDLVDQIQRVYRSQGVRVSDKHIEIIVRQMTSKALTLEDGMADAFLPGELIELSRAQRMNRALGRSISYKPIVLGVTKASLNTTSFIPEASFQETTRVLARAAIRGRIDWLKGLKENVILGGIVPTGTGNEEVICRMTLGKRGGIILSGTTPPNNEMKSIISYHGNLFILPNKKHIREELRRAISGRDSDQ